MPSGPVPLSIYQYGNDADATGGAAAAGGATGLAGAIIGNPQALAQARYLGAQTGVAQGQAAQQQQDMQAQQQFAGLLSSGAAATPQGMSKLLATAAMSPTLSARAVQLAEGAYAANAVGAPGQTTPTAGQPTVAQASNLAALTGVAPMGSTPTGYNQGLQTDIEQSNISAGATLGAANISAKAAEADTAATIQGENARALVPVKTPTGVTYMPATQAGQTGADYYDPSVANTVAQAGAAPQAYVTPQGVRLGTAGYVEQNGLTPAPSTSDQASADILAQATNTNPNAAPPGGGMGAPSVVNAFTSPTNAGASSPGAAAPGPVAAPSPTPTTSAPPAAVLPPDERQQLINAVVSKFTGQPMPGSTDATQAADVDNLITARLQAAKPGTFGVKAYVPAPALMNPIRLQAAWLYAHDPNVRGNMQQAVTQAIINVTGANSQNISRDVHMPNWMGGQPGPSSLDLNDPSQIVWPQGMQVPPQYAPQGQGQPQGQPGAPYLPAQAQPQGMANVIAPQAQPVPLQPPAQPGAAPQAQAQGMPPQQIMAQAQAAINQIQASSDPPQVQAQKIQMIRQRLIQMGALPGAQQ